jgi:uncharacterized protein (TIGR02284 family)
MLYKKEIAMQATQDTHTALNHLIEVCRDGQEGFAAAAKVMQETPLHAELIQYSLQRRGFALDLEASLNAMGDTPQAAGSVAAAIHRGWMNLKAAIAKNDRYAVLAECERGEDCAVRTYREAIGADLGPSIGSLVRSQLEQVQRVHDRIKALRDAAKHK